MVDHAFHSALARFVDRLKPLSGTALADAISGEITETGGTYMPPPPQEPGRNSHFVEIIIYGITGRGRTEPEAIADWIDAATNVVEKQGVAA